MVLEHVLNNALHPPGAEHGDGANEYAIRTGVHEAPRITPRENSSAGVNVLFEAEPSQLDNEFFNEREEEPARETATANVFERGLLTEREDEAPRNSIR